MSLLSFIKRIINGSDEPNVESTSGADYDQFIDGFANMQMKQEISVHDVGIFSSDDDKQCGEIKLGDDIDQSDENDTYDKIEIG